MNEQSQQICRDDDPFPIKQSFADSLFSWGKKFSEAASSLKSMDPLIGSLSYRYGLGFVITSAKAHFKKLTQSHLICVEKQDSSLDRMIIRGKGDLPEENFLHATVYQNRSGAIFSFFFSYKKKILLPSSFNLPVIENLDQPPSELVKKLERKLGQGNTIILHHCGILSFGCTADDAGEQLLSVMDALKKLQ